MAESGVGQRRHAMAVLDLYFVGRVVVVCTVCFAYTACFLGALLMTSTQQAPDMLPAWLSLQLFGVICTALLCMVLRDKLHLIVPPPPSAACCEQGDGKCTGGVA